MHPASPSAPFLPYLFRLDYQSGQRNEKEQRGEYTPRPKHQIVLAWVLIAIVVLGVLGMCYWEIFGKF